MFTPRKDSYIEVRGRNMDRRQFIGLTATGMMACSLPKEGSQASTFRLQKKIPLTQPYDLIVCGGGAAGVAAALAAGRAGMKVLLAEGQGQLGGMATSGLVSHWLGGRTTDCLRWAVGGIFRAMSQEAHRRGFALIPKDDPNGRLSPHGWGRGMLTAGIPFDPYHMAAYLDELCAESGVETLFYTQAVEPVVHDDRITHLILFNKSGLQAVPVKAVVDATGDADIAARSGCDFETGREGDGGVAAATLQFHASNVDRDKLGAFIHNYDARRFRDKITSLRKRGEWTFPYDIFIATQIDKQDVFMINTSRLVGIDGTDAKSVTQGVIKGRRETIELLRLMQKHFPGFENARIKAVAPLLGVRESRRIKGRYRLSVEDLNRQNIFADTIGYSAYGWDLPDPDHPSCNPGHGKRSEVIAIPYRIMIPAPVGNLICPGRAVSVERPVLGPLRVMAPCMAMGEAAGTASLQAIGEGKRFDQVDTALLRQRLKSNGAIVEWPV